MYCSQDLPSMLENMLDTWKELLMGSLVMILIVPPTALAPNSAEPPPRTTSTLSIMFTGICSRPYTPLSALMTGRLFIRICEYGPSRPLIRTWGKPQFWQLFSTRRPDW